MEATTFSTPRGDHLGMVAGVCRHIPRREPGEARVGPAERQGTVGEAVHAMGLKAGGCASRAL